MLNELDSVASFYSRGLNMTLLSVHALLAIGLLLFLGKLISIHINLLLKGRRLGQRYSELPNGYRVLQLDSQIAVQGGLNIFATTHPKGWTQTSGKSSSIGPMSRLKFLWTPPKWLQCAVHSSMPRLGLGNRLRT